MDAVKNVFPKGVNVRVVDDVEAAVNGSAQRGFVGSRYDGDAELEVVKIDVPLDAEARKDTAKIRNEILKPLIGQEVEILSDGRVVHIENSSKDALKKRGIHRAILPALKELISKSNYFDYRNTDGKEKHGGVLGQFVYVVPVLLGDKVYRCELLIDRKVSSGTGFGSFKQQSVFTVSDAKIAGVAMSDGIQSVHGASASRDAGTTPAMSVKFADLMEGRKPNVPEVRFQSGGYMGGGEWSYRANEALNRGLRPAAMIAKDLGASIEAVEDVLRSDEWHHVGEDFEEVYFYNADDVAVETPDSISDADDARSVKNVVMIKNWETRPEPKIPSKFSRESGEEYNSAFLNTNTRADKQAKEAEDAFDKAIESYENGETDLAGLQEAAKQFENDYAAGIKAKKEAVKAFLAKHKDWKRPPKRRAKIGANGLRYQRAFHGSPHNFSAEENAPLGRFRDDKMGSGEGQQMFGWGHYLTSEEKI
ncbi:MAG: hypothetical protein IJW12_03210, partial [Opitutales bacterium]|nr:hypothetical protein [Opitutales bacterium]